MLPAPPPLQGQKMAAIVEPWQFALIAVGILVAVGLFLAFMCRRGAGGPSSCTCNCGSSGAARGGDGALHSLIVSFAVNACLACIFLHWAKHQAEGAEAEARRPRGRGEAVRDEEMRALFVGVRMEALPPT